MEEKILIHAWLVEKKGNNYYLPYTHWIYLQEIMKYNDRVVLLSPCKKVSLTKDITSLNIKLLGNVEVYELPAGANSYLGSLRYFLSYVKAYYSINSVTTYYSRYPTPFGWVQKVLGKNKRRIIHYVGDPSDAAKNNPNFHRLKKTILINGFRVEDALYSWACKGAEVYTNGHHLAEKLKTKNIEAIPLISSTLCKSDFYFESKEIEPRTAKFIYLGNLRTAKGVETLIKAFELYNEKYPNSTFTIIGTGEFEDKLKKIVRDKGIRNVHFLGRIDDRELLNKELRAADVFLFGSLSEGSPRVVLEAMANGLAVISTPVGSLPSHFKDKKEIIFSGFKDYKSFFINMESLVSNNSYYNALRITSYYKVQEATVENFLKEIFLEKKYKN